MANILSVFWEIPSIISVCNWAARGSTDFGAAWSGTRPDKEGVEDDFMDN
jgi:hypothetical protein